MTRSRAGKAARQYRRRVDAFSVAAAMARLDRFAGNFSFELRKRQQDVQGATAGRQTSMELRFRVSHSITRFEQDQARELRVVRFHRRSNHTRLFARSVLPKHA
jgi:hypothetical protein